MTLHCVVLLYCCHVTFIHFTGETNMLYYHIMIEACGTTVAVFDSEGEARQALDAIQNIACDGPALRIVEVETSDD